MTPNPAVERDCAKARSPSLLRYTPWACLRFSCSSKIRFISPASRNAWHDEHTRLMSRPILSLSGTVAGFSPQISHIFFAISILLLHNKALKQSAALVPWYLSFSISAPA